MTFAPRDPAEVLPAPNRNEDDAAVHQKDGSTILELCLVFFFFFLIYYSFAFKCKHPNWLILVYSYSVVKLQEVPLSDMLPQDLLVDILIERFQVSWLFF